MSDLRNELDWKWLRIVDAAANRASEGLRVVEDYVRFGLDDAFLTAQLKTLRHEIAGIINQIPNAQRLAARETTADVGTQITTPTEQSRCDWSAILTANWKRLQEALRTMEESCKLISSELGQRCEQLRYCSYTLEKATGNLTHVLERLADCRLYVLLTGAESEAAFVEQVRQLAVAEVDVIQLRDKQLDDRQLLERGRLLRQTLQEMQLTRSPLFVMNDRPDLAVLCQADGVHVGQSELPVSAVRQIVGPQLLIGVSTHSVAQAQQAVLDGASYIGVGPTFPSQTKSFEQFTGLELLQSVAGQIKLPAFAIGGITLQNLQQVLSTGFQRVAVSAAIQQAADPAQAAQQFRQLLTQ
jgi:thiamine-phosphate pyrophosphorylase